MNNNLLITASTGFILIIWFLSVLIGTYAGSKKGEGFTSLILTFLFGPLWLPFVFISKGNKKQCPYCREYIHKKAIICSHCRKEQI